MMRKLTLIFLLAGLCGQLQAQVPTEKDSLERLLGNHTADTNRVNLLFSLSELYDTNEIERAKKYILEAGQLSEELDYAPGIVRFNKRMMYIHAILSQNDSAIWYGQKLLDKAIADKDTFNIGIALFNIGERYNYKSDYETGLEHSLQGMKILEGGNYPKHIKAAVIGSVSVTYLMMKNYEKSIEYGRKAEAIERTLSSKTPLSATLINLGNAFSELNRTEEAEQVYKEALELVRQEENISYEILVYQGLVDLNSRQNNTEAIKMYGERGLALSIQLDDSYNKMVCSEGLSGYYLRTGNFSKAKALLLGALEIAERDGYIESKGSILKSLANVSFAEQDYVAGFRYQTQSTKLLADIFSESLAQKHAEFRERYETEKKESQILIQQEQIKQKTTLNYLLIGGAVALAVISLLGYRNYSHRQRLQQAIIEELETEKQLNATEAILKGEEQERTRLAKDLHDGLGGMLSGIKYSFQTMKENLILTPENAQAFGRSIDMLDSSIKEMRRVAHNMMPEMLVKYGLNVALKEFCNEIDRSGALKVIYQSIGMEAGTIEQTTAVTVYRIVQELVHNAIKHANATQVLVQVHASWQEKTMVVTVEDDGKGFDTALLQDAQGIGWSNIQHRVDFLKGKIDVNSAPLKGTSVLLELPLG